ncbi:MAG: glycosyltransferase family 39 protein [Ardenticatenaceae bacterium]|nr:glycosyltransferase family 39 protein [Ardenticatenaceae bacterium]
MVKNSQKTTVILLIILLTAAFLRFWQLADHPPGWRDDELINSLVISQHVIDGDWRLYYDDASGHEALYHILNALPLYLFGPSAAGIRWLSALMGIQTVWLTFLLGREMFDRDDVGLIAAAGMTVSFWSLMYSRIGLRHIALLFFVLPTFYLLWRGIKRDSRRSAIWGGMFLGLTFYTYFASRGVPLIIGAWLFYLLVFNRRLLVRAWGKTWLVLAIGIVLAVPLFAALQQQPEAEARVAELAVPLIEAQKGNFEPLLTFTIRTLNMFHSDGDDEFLYNIPGRPVFGPLTAIFFWAGVLIALWQTIKPSPNNPQPAPYAFLILWWLAGISPAFISVPPGSLSHTILAQPAVYLLLAVPVIWLGDVVPPKRRPFFLVGVSLLLIGFVAARDLPDYFVTWPQRGNTRFLYRADLHGVAQALSEMPEAAQIGVTSQLLGPWDRVALQANLDRHQAGSAPVLFNPERAILIEPPQSWINYPTDLEPFEPAAFRETEKAEGGYRLAEINLNALPAFEEENCFENGLCVAFATTQIDEQITLDLLVRVDQTLDLPDIPLISNPPPPDVYAGPRLLIFAQLLTEDGSFLTGDDAFGVDPQTLTVGEKFWQRHRLIIPDGTNPATIAFGFYDPMSGERILTKEGLDAIRIDLIANS